MWDLIVSVPRRSLLIFLLQDELEKVQNRAAIFLTGNFNYESGSMTGILYHLK